MVRTTSAEFGTEIERLLRSFPRCKGNNKRASKLRISIELKPPAPRRGTRPFHFFYREGQRIGKSTDWWQLFRFLEWQLDIFLAAAVTKSFLLHGGAVAKNGEGSLFLGESGSGKSSLTLAMLERGYQYYTDDLVIIDPKKAELSPFPKPFSLKDPSLFPALQEKSPAWLGPNESRSPDRRKRTGRNDKLVWYIHPADVRPDAVGTASVPVTNIFFPIYDPQSEPHIEPLTSGQAMRRLFINTVNFDLIGPGGLGLVSRLVKSARCFKVVVNGPDATAALIEQIV